MSVNNFTTGKDLSFVLVTPFGVVRLEGVTDYHAKQISNNNKHTGIDGRVRHVIIPQGWEITIPLDRQDSTVDDLIARLEADYFAGVNIQGGTLLEAIRNKDDSVSQYRYEGAVLAFGSVGSYKADSLVSQEVMVYSSRRIKVS